MSERCPDTGVARPLPYDTTARDEAWMTMSFHRTHGIFTGGTVAAVGLLALLAGCADGEDSRTAAVPVVRDSAGVSIIENPALSDAPTAYYMSEQPSLHLGGLRDNLGEELSASSGWLSTVELSDGRIVVGDDTRLKFFDGSGKLLRVAGGKGEGPGEFGNIREICRTPGDSILVIEYTRPRLSLFTASGEFVRASQVPGHIPLNGCFGDGTVLIQTATSADAPSSGSDDGAEFVRARSDGTIIGLGDDYVVMRSRDADGAVHLTRHALEAAR